MRFNLITLIRAVSAAALLLCGVSPALAQASMSPKTRCENTKLRAASSDTSGLVRAITKANIFDKTPSQHAITRCNEHFDLAFNRAEPAAPVGHSRRIAIEGGGAYDSSRLV